MSEIMRVNSASFDRYEELLLRKNDLRKECFQLEQEYIRVFGEDILAVFHAQVECARKVKTIEFCHRAINQGKDPDTAELQVFVEKETKELQDHFAKMTEEYEAAKDTGTVTEAELMEIRKIYRKLAKRMHPDIHPELADSEKILELWNQISVAYTCNDLKELKELEVLVVSALKEDGSEIAVEIPDLGEKIASLEKEIEKITTTDPWRYQFLLNDPEAVKEKKEALREELKKYQEHSAQLDKMLEEILPDGTVIFWD